MTKTMFFEEMLSAEKRKDIFWVGAILIGLCLCSYIYLATQTVRNIVATQNLTDQTQNISEQISSKEFSLISLESNITLQYAASLGFADAKQKIFISPSKVSFVSDDTNASTL